MFRMVPGVDLAPPPGHGSSRPPAGVVGGLCAVLAVSLAGSLVFDGGAPPASPPGETEMAQRSAAVVAGTYLAQVDIDRRDRMLLVSYQGTPALTADRFAWAVCDTIRTVPVSAGSAQTLRDWQVVAMPSAGLPGSCWIGARR